MTDFTSFSPVPSSDFDNLPLPERIAKRYNFALAYHDLEDGKRYYAVQDWIKGVAQSIDPATFWTAMKRRFNKAGLTISEQCRKLGYKTKDEKTYKMDHAPAETLTAILKMMSLKTGIVSDIMLGEPYQQGHRLEGLVYLISINEIPGKYKIGMTKNINQRINNFRVTVPAT